MFRILENSTEPSSKCGTIVTRYDLLVKTFGNPHKYVLDGAKVDVNWIIQFEDGTIAIIYNYKNGINYLGMYGIPVEEITNWQVNGENSRCVDLIERAIAEREGKQLDLFDHISKIK
jgi:hypothetical protein